MTHGARVGYDQQAAAATAVVVQSILALADTFQLIEPASTLLSDFDT